MTANDRHTEAFDTETGNIVYVKPVPEAETLELSQREELIGADLDQGLFSVHMGQSGERIAIVVGRDAAFAAARAYDLRPRSVH